MDGNLNLSRALGDLVYKQNAALPWTGQKISAEPDVTVEYFLQSCFDFYNITIVHFI